jgi:hypothetical protein
MECTPIHHHRRGVTELYQPLHQVTEVPGFPVLETAPDPPNQLAGREPGLQCCPVPAVQRACAPAMMSCGRLKPIWPTVSTCLRRQRVAAPLQHRPDHAQRSEVYLPRRPKVHVCKVMSCRRFLKKSCICFGLQSGLTYARTYVAGTALKDAHARSASPTFIVIRRGRWNAAPKPLLLWTGHASCRGAAYALSRVQGTA